MGNLEKKKITCYNIIVRFIVHDMRYDIINNSQSVAKTMK